MDVVWACTDLEKAYDTIDRHGMCQMLRVCGLGRKMLQAVQSIYGYSWACVRVGMDVSERFPFNFGLRHGCVVLQL